MTIARKFLLIDVTGAMTPNAGLVSPHATMMKENFGQMDANKGGDVTQSETYGYRKSQFATAHTEHDSAPSISDLDVAMAVFHAGHLK